MKVLVVGNGGREHALSWRFQQSPHVEQVYCAPSNPGMKNVINIDITDFEELADFAIAEGIDLVVPGPEAPLCVGIVDVFRTKGLKIFGPNKKAAQLEGSKSYAKDFMNRHAIPTAEAGHFNNEADALTYIQEKGAPIVVKADGLAAGKGVTVAQSIEEAEQAVKDCFEGSFGDAGYEVVIEECLIGEEASILAFVDGKTIKPLASSQDHKAVGEGDTGPNTGGMGAYSPAPVVDEALWKTVDQLVLQPFLKGVQDDGLDFRGIIYAGIMVTEKGPKVLEFNVRFGDPETQAVLFRMESCLAEAMLASVNQELADFNFAWSSDPAVCVVLASGGYPASYEKGFEITGIDEAEAATGAVVFHAGTSIIDGKLVNTGGRVLGVTAKGKDLREAVDTAYAAVDRIHWEGAFCRRDIAHKAFDR
ncbi:MAG: phosphoribosylamine--glycine ligase [Lentisphaeria bacterium]|nr:phosphoribosylamine--glycine ligase [Lentisphaeria bacterium]